MTRSGWIKSGLGLCVLAGVGAAVYFAVWAEDPAGRGLAMDPGDRAQVALGRKLYAAQCASCHGKNLEGEADWRKPKPDGSLRAPPHDRTGHTWHHPDQLLFAYTKFGGAKVTRGAVKSNMPGFEGTLSDSEIAAILAFIKSRWPADVRQRQQTMTEAYRNR
ncbi:MAG: cytochrome c [Bauldia litoralis]